MSCWAVLRLVQARGSPVKIDNINSVATSLGGGGGEEDSSAGRYDSAMFTSVVAAIFAAVGIWLGLAEVA